jgi:pimeloyl-ACP methyl ester carboxylesterase
MGTGLYPFVPAAGLHWALSRRKKESHQSPGLLAKEWAVAVAGVVTRPLGLAGERMKSRRVGEGRPLILVHGYAMNRACFLALASRLAKEGVGPIYGFEYWSFSKVSSSARNLDRFIEEICARYGCEQVDIVGHSMGGIVARYYLTLGAGRDRRRVARLVTLGTPHGGSVFSMFGVGQPNKQLRPRAAFLERLASAQIPSDTQVTVLWSKADALVGTADQARWDGAEEVVYDNLGHISLLYSKRVAAEIAKRLALGAAG